MNRRRPNSIWLYTLGISVLVLLASPLLFAGLRPDDYEGGRSKDEVRTQERNSSAIGRILGEFRTGMSDVMFIKTERYLHTGVAYTAHMATQEVKAGATSDHAGQAGTLIRPPEEDFRGFIGELERRVQPWQDPNAPHLHTSGDELLPWYRLMTISDPNYVRGYLIGTYWLMSNDLVKAQEFIDEGIDNNPEAFQLHYMKGQVLRRKARTLLEEDPEANREQAIELDFRALQSFREGAEYVVQQREPGSEPPRRNTWTDYMEEDARGVCRLAVFQAVALVRDLDLPEDQEAELQRQALEDARRFQNIFIDDGPLGSAINNLEPVVND